MKTSILIMRPQGEEPAPADQVLGARLAAGPDIDVHEQLFEPEQPGDLEARFDAWRGRIAARVIGAMRVPDAQALGKAADEMNVLCFVANNNPVVWQKRRHVFHIGYPTSQTTTAVAAELAETGRRRFLLLHDTTEFQARVAATMNEKLRGLGGDVRALAYRPGDAFDLGGWLPELVYVVFSSERKALQVVHALADRMPEVPLLFGRSLFRETFLQSLRGRAGEFWFVDTNFRRSTQSGSQQEFTRVMAENGVRLPTTNHAFGWDGMKFCAAALKAAHGYPQSAIDYLESGVTLEGAGGACSFTPDNHNGRHGRGPTIISCWRDDAFAKV